MSTMPAMTMRTTANDVMALLGAQRPAPINLTDGVIARAQRAAEAVRALDVPETHGDEYTCCGVRPGVVHYSWCPETV